MRPWLLSFSPLISFFINIATYLICVKIHSKIGLSIVFGIAIGLICDLILVCFSSDTSNFTILDVSISLLTYLAWSFCFWAFLNLNITSLRIRIVRDLLKEKTLSTDKLFSQHSQHELIMRRLKRLVSTNQITKHQGKWRLKSKKLLIFVYVSIVLRKLIIPSKRNSNEVVI